MPAADADLQDKLDGLQPLTQLPFPPLRKSHILHCSYHYWYPKYRAVTPKSRLVPLTQPFLSYLRADGIILPPDDRPVAKVSDSDSDALSRNESEESESSENDEDPSAQWPDVHSAVKKTIAELGGKVVPKLNWSAPKDATWISATNSIDSQTANDIYLLLKSSDFVTHDLEHAFDGCVDDELGSAGATDIPYHLVLRKHFLLNPSLEFRCFVRRRKLIAICQRDLNHFDFLFNLQRTLRERIQAFFETRLEDTFPDENFAFDVYIPAPHNRVWLIDINPWARRTDPILFSWLELLTMPEYSSGYAIRDSMSMRGDSEATGDSEPLALDDSDVEDTLPFVPELRLIGKDDPEAYSFATPQYSAHKLPRDVVDASQAGPGPMRDFADQWKEMLAQSREERDSDNESHVP